MPGTNLEECLLTVIIPYLPNPDNFVKLDKLLEEVLKLPINVLLCIDTDDTAVISSIQSSLAYSKKVKIKFEGNRSPGLTRNLGIDSVETPYFAFWDADDQVQPAEVTSLIDEVAKTTPFLGVSRFGYISSKSKTRRWSKIEFMNSLEVGANPGLWRWIFKTSQFKDIRFSNLSIGEDVEYLLKALSLGKPITYFDQVTYQYRKPTTEIESQSIRGAELLSTLVLQLISIYELSKPNRLTIASILAKQYLSAIFQHVGKGKDSHRRRMGRALLRVPISEFVLVLIMIASHAALKLSRVSATIIFNEGRNV